MHWLRIAIFVFSCTLLSTCVQRTQYFAPPVSDPNKPLIPQAPGEMGRYQMDRRVAANSDGFPMNAFARAQTQMSKMRTYSAKQGEFIDATQAKSGNPPRWSFLGPSNVAGRTRTMEFDPRDPLRIYSAGVSGGLWQTRNGGTTWEPLSDQLASINIGAIAVDPVQPDTLYLGTGELYRNTDRPYSAMWGQGMMRSVDSGQTFQQLLATSNSDFRYVSDIVISPNTNQRLYVASNTGIWRSQNRGASFEQILRPANEADLLYYEGCNDLLIQNINGKDSLIAACSSRSVDDRYYLPGTVLPPACNGPCPAALYRNADAGGSANWERVLTEAGMGRTQMDASKSNPNIIYASSASIALGFDRSGDGIGDYDNALHAIWRSDDHGQTWQARLRNSSPDALSTYIFSYANAIDAVRCNFGEPYFYSAGWYNHAIAVNPLNPESLWVAGMELYRSDDGGRSFGKGSYWWYFDPSTVNEGVHADLHVIRYHPQYNGSSNKRLYVANDGGLAYTLDEKAGVTRGVNAACAPAANNVQWRALNQELGTTQFYTGSVSLDGSMVIGGAQDNGTLLNRFWNQSSQFTHVYGGDGATSAIDPRNANVFYASSQGGNIRRTENGGSSFVAANAGINDTPHFIMPFILDPSSPDRLYAAGTKLWRTTNKGAAWTQASASLGNDFAHRVSAMAVAPNNPNRMLLGNQIGIYRNHQVTSSNSGTLWPSVSPRAGWVSSLIFHPTDANIAYATYSTFGGKHVWRSDNGGASWTAIDGSGAGALPDIPVHTLAIDPNNTSRLFIGTDLGVFVSVDGGENWAMENTGFANVIVESLQIAPGGGIHPLQLFAFTYGRGIWNVPLSDLDGVADYNIAPDLSGAFYDPAQAGHGWMIETLNIEGVTQVLATWYTYLNGEQRWLVGTGIANGNQVRIPLIITRNGQFPPNFNAEQVQRENWGEVILRFDSKNNGTASWTSSYAGFNNGSMPLQKLTSLGASSGSYVNGQLHACHSGTWYNVNQSGHGFSVQVYGTAQNPEAFFVWYNYLNGQQRWLVGNGAVTSAGIDLPMQITSGGNFPPNFNPANVAFNSWGQASFTPTGKDQAQVTWTSNYPGFSSGSMSVSRLSSPLGHSCPQ